MWTTGIFISEMCGTFTLTFLTLFVVLASKSSVIGLKSSGKIFFIAIGSGIALIFGILVAFGVASTNGTSQLGHVNPAVTLMYAMAWKNYDFILSSLLGQVMGAIIGSLIVSGIFIITYSKNPIAFQDAQETFAMPDEKKPIAKSFMGEMLASFIFLGIIMAVINSKQSIIFIGLANTLVLLTFGLRFSLILNPFATIMPMFIGLLMTKPNNWNFAITNLSVGAITNVGVATSLGAIYAIL